MIDTLLHRMAARIVVLAHLALPPDAKSWGSAMKCELANIERGAAALTFAIGCLHAAAGERVLSLLDEARALSRRLASTIRPTPSGASAMELPALIARHPFGTGLTCAVTATGLGLVHLAMGQAPLGYLAINFIALMLGLVAIQMVNILSQGKGFDPGLAALLIGLTLVVLGQLSQPLNGAARWISLGGVTVQPSLLLVPLLTVCFAASRNALAAWGVAAAAAALALQPDRAMAGALAGATGVVAIAALSRHTASAAAIAAASFAITLLRPDLQSAVPFVDQIYRSALNLHPLAGVAVILGTALLLLPALGALRPVPKHREIHAAFGAVWLGIATAAALGNYPTPVVGYSGSAVLGYVLSLLLFHPAMRDRLMRDHSSEAVAEKEHAQLQRAIA